MELWNLLPCRGLEFEGDVRKRPEYAEEAYGAGKDLVKGIRKITTGQGGILS
jgi:hypothetical protein